MGMMKKLAAEAGRMRRHPGEFGHSECPELKVAILYDQLRAGRHALIEVQNASRGLAHPPLLDLRLWRFDFLLDDVLAELAISEIVAADVVLICIEQEQKL